MKPSPEGVVFRHTVEALLERVVRRKQLLTSAELADLGITQPRDVDFDTWMRLITTAARKLSPGKPPDAALEDAGREMVRGYLDGLVGKSLFMVMRLLGPRRALLRMAENLATTDTITRVQARAVGPTTIELEYNYGDDVVGWLRGVVSESLAAMGTPQHRIEARPTPTGGSLLTITW